MNGTRSLMEGGQSHSMIEQADLDALQEGIARVLDTEVDRLRLHEHIDRKIDLGRLLWSRAAELGWPAIGLPEEYGGLGLGALGLAVLHRELGRRAAPGPFMASLSAAQVLLEVAEEDIRAEWLPRIAAGECNLAVTAQVKPSGERWLLGAEDAKAALVPIDEDRWGLVPLAGSERVAVWDQTRSVIAADLTHTAPIAVFSGEAAARSLSRHLSLAIACDSIAGAHSMTEQTVAYMKERQQFGRAIASFQALKHRIADHMSTIVSGEEFVAFAVEAAAMDGPDADIWSNLAKVRATETFARTSSDCLQLHGGVGFTWEFDVHVYLNRAWLGKMLVAPNRELRDRAADGLASAVRAGRQPLELAL